MGHVETGRDVGSTPRGGVGRTFGFRISRARDGGVPLDEGGRLYFLHQVFQYLNGFLYLLMEDVPLTTVTLNF